MILRELWKVLNTPEPIWINYGEECELVQTGVDLIGYMDKEVTYITTDGEGVITIEIE